MTVLDISNHDYSTFDPDCLKASGVVRVIVGCWDLGITLDIVARSRAAGIIAEELYCFLYPGLAWEQREVLNALEVQRQLGGIVRAWPDCESQFTEWPGDLDTEAAGMTVAGRLDALRRARATLAGARMRLGTYTGESYWRSMYGDSSEFAADPLWLANYGSNDPANPRPPITTVAFGGWTSVYRHQYSSTIEVCGRNRDHNYDFAEESDMDLSDRVARLERLIAAHGIALDPSKPAELTIGQAALEYADENGWSAFLGIGLARQRIAEHEASPHDGAAAAPITVRIPGGTVIG